MGKYSIEYNEAVTKRLSMVLKSLLRSMKVSQLVGGGEGVGARFINKEWVDI
jgi:hypothetical protein